MHFGARTLCHNPRGSSVDGVGRVHFGVCFWAFWGQNRVPQSAGLLGKRCRKGACWGAFLCIFGARTLCHKPRGSSVNGVGRVHFGVHEGSSLGIVLIEFFNIL